MNNLLEIKNLSKKYLNKTALENVTLNLDGGKIYGLMGPNGSGKTTLMKVIAGLHKASSGDVLINGEPVSYKTKGIVAYMPTENFLLDSFKVSSIINYYKDMYNDFDKDKCINLVKKLGIDMNQKVSALSSGLVAKLKLAVTLSRQAAIYMLDEPLNGIDIIAREAIIETIINSYDENKIIIISSHIVDEIEKIFDAVVFIKDSAVALAGDAEELRTQKQMSIENIYKEVYR
jgi:ABC-2 type transport system ATP-binding protein